MTSPKKIRATRSDYTARGLAGHLMGAGECLADLYHAPHATRERLTECAHRLAACGLSTRAIADALAEAHDRTLSKAGVVSWNAPTHATIGAWLRNECPMAYD